MEQKQTKARARLEKAEAKEKAAVQAVADLAKHADELQSIVDADQNSTSSQVEELQLLVKDKDNKIYQLEQQLEEALQNAEQNKLRTNMLRALQTRRKERCY